MLDLHFIRENAEAVQKNCKNRNLDIDVPKLLKLDQQHRTQMSELQSVQHKRNQLAKSMKGRKPSDDERETGKQLKQKEADLEQQLNLIKSELNALHTLVPNITQEDVPIGKTDEDNRQLRVVGEIRHFDFPVKDHVELGELHDILDFESGAKVAGQKFFYLKNELVILDLALTRFVLDILRAKGFTLFQTPDLARASIAMGLGFNPRGEETQIYSITDTDLVLVGTAEITLGGLHQDEILDTESLPRLYCGLSHCFRTEAGAHGRASRGLYRVHQFSKVEMFAYATAEQSQTIHEQFVALEEEIFSTLEIPFRVVDVCTGDLGSPAFRKYDLEAWIPSRGEKGDWGEITSTSNCTDYQARRLGIRYRDPETKKTRFCHLLNGTAMALSRAILALMENHQQKDGSITIPKALQAYTGFDKIG